MSPDLNTAYVGKFIGPQKIVNVAQTTQVTPTGSMIFLFTVSHMVNEQEIKEEILVPEKSIPLMVTETETDWNTLSASKINIIIEEVVNVLEEYNIEKMAIDTFMQGLKTSLNYRFDRAKNFLWTGNDDSFIPGYDPDRDASILLAEKVIQSIPKTDADRETKDDNAS